MDAADFRLIQDDIVVAQVSGVRQDALREINHYALVYGQDGPVEIQERRSKRWRKAAHDAETALYPKG